MFDETRSSAAAECRSCLIHCNADVCENILRKAGYERSGIFWDVTGLLFQVYILQALDVRKGPNAYVSEM
jgi:hypothetical protein